MHISDITIYPIKGCQGQILQQVTVTPMGLQGDREFTVLAGGSSANQKLLPDLRQLQATMPLTPSVIEECRSGERW